MEISTYAYTIGILELIIGLPLLFYSRQTMKWVDKALKEDLVLRFVGALLTVISALVLLDDYVIGSNPEGLIRLLAWMLLLKGLLHVWYPKTVMELKKKWMSSDAMLTLGGLVAVGVGLILLYAGMVL